MPCYAHSIAPRALYIHVAPFHTNPRLLTNSPVEERILARATDKKNLNGLVVEAGRFNVRNNNTTAYVLLLCLINYNM